MADLRQLLINKPNQPILLRIFLALALISSLIVSGTTSATAAPASPTITSASTITTGGTQSVRINFTRGDATTLTGLKYSTDGGVTYHECDVNGRCDWASANNYVQVEKLSSGTSSMSNGASIDLRLKACSGGSPNSSGTGLTDCSSESGLVAYTVGSPSITTTSTISNGQSNPTIDVTGTDFETPTSLSMFTISVGTTTLTASGVTFNSSTSLTFSFTGTAVAGTITIQAKTTSYNPDASYASNTLSVIVPALVPGAPTSVTADTGTASSFVVSWVAPTSDGGAAITDYGIQYSSNNGSTWETFTASASTALSRTVNGLVGNTNYIFRVTAKNSVGYGNYSSNSSQVTTSGLSVPETPTAISAGSATSSSLVVSWTAPSNNGGAAISDYWLQYSSNNGSTWETFTATASATASRTVTGLSASTAYVFRVAAKNSVGYGPFSDSSTSVSTSAASAPAPAPAPEVIPAPIINKVSKTKVCSRGGDQILIQGSYLANATITLDGKVVQGRGNSSNSVLVDLEESPAGEKILKLTTPSGSASTILTFKLVDRTAFKVFYIPYIYKGGEFNYTFEAFGENTYRVTGNFPAGLTLNELTGEVSGIPTEEGIFNFVIHADGVCGNDSDVIRLDIDKEIPNAKSFRIKFPNKKTNKIGAAPLFELKKFLKEIEKISPKQIEPVIFISGGAPEGEPEIDSEEAKARRDAICDVLLTQDILAQTIAGIFAGEPDVIEIFVYWPVPR